MSIFKRLHTIAFSVNNIAIGLFFGINIAAERGLSMNSSWQHYEEVWLMAMMAWVVIGALAALFHWLHWKPHAWFELASTLGAMFVAIWWLTVLNGGELLAAFPAIIVLMIAPLGLPAPIVLRLRAILLSPAFAPEPSAAELAQRDEWDAKRQNGEQRGW